MAKPGKKDYGVSAEKFCELWQSSDSLREVEERLAEYAEQIGMDPMPKEVILARSSTYRREGVQLRKFPKLQMKKRRRVEELNELIRRINAEKGIKSEASRPAPKKDVRNPPEKVDDVVDKIVKESRRKPTT